MNSGNGTGISGCDNCHVKWSVLSNRGVGSCGSGLRRHPFHEWTGLTATRSGLGALGHLVMAGEQPQPSLSSALQRSDQWDRDSVAGREAFGSQCTSACLGSWPTLYSTAGSEIPLLLLVVVISFWTFRCCWEVTTAAGICWVLSHLACMNLFLNNKYSTGYLLDTSL